MLYAGSALGAIFAGGLFTLQYLGFTALAFILFLPKLHGENMISFDTDWFYRNGTVGFLWLANR